MLERNEELDKRFLDPNANSEDIGSKNLRPKYLNEFIGQDNIKKKLSVTIEAAKIRDDQVDHIVLAGPPGLGKTTLAHIIANEIGSNLHITSGPVIERAGDLAAMLTNLEKGDILFIDEIHRLNRSIEEILYSAMEDFQLDIVIGKGPSARSIRIDLQPFTLIGATTRLGLIAPPLRSRFGIVLEMDFYPPKDLQLIIQRSAVILNIEITEDAAFLLAQRARGTPRIANRLLKRIRDYVQVQNKNLIEVEDVINAMKLFEMDEDGLDKMDRKILKTIIENYEGGPVGINALASSLGIEPDSISEVYEPYLLQSGFIIRTPRGRVATKKSYKKFNLNKKLSDKDLSLWSEIDE
ncbi:MAG: Holliday junction branch migration DNA helicase RuvB [Defluviitoga tunisiensis]|jgi:Holliday junction DNA helicase RuvB|uniref:Holliday junction branch migration complex subunit RuvB n=1 Tax=Defluviitoga tunisiensis TaxID=1006576 RepID=A0A0C7NZ73_DEFTU|nr:Holliday junction branch migration DNA helicase RuvB [Defluviitoga tunisiensis]MDD3600929.1 Holliday junction branch migration DNA helicase RuvB [Defluviitoga tunisiensis]MDY0379023.1 Holliday junction branch migration DNA helicase RuvB [Defluviitoga tunisiensis]CEP78593.1 Holliday junction ATP-dependent DNA helicase RuvB [Defluviitoga tunisiensis]HHV01472.1 Holliday junction branch migration DNA helicase RuvB [Defluviitoga tunisiensis]HOB55029.1 Holliday junction branch migration DNA helic